MIAITELGFASGVALATAVGVLFEASLMLVLVLVKAECNVSERAFSRSPLMR